MSMFERFKQFIYQPDKRTYELVENEDLVAVEREAGDVYIEGLACPVSHEERPKLALALGGGATKGYAHIGVLRMLDHMGVIPDMVIGTSAGSLVGSLYAAGMSSAQLSRLALQLEESDIRDLTLSRQGLVKGEKLQNLVNSFVQHKPIEKFVIPFAAVATEPNSGNTVILDHGDAGLAVRASCSIPGVFIPVDVGGRLLVDGGVSCPVPVSVARELGADIVIAVDISGKQEQDRAEGLFGMIGQSINVMNRHILNVELSRADFVIQPDVQGIRLSDVRSKVHLVRQGFKAAHSQSHELRALLEKNHWFENAQTLGGANTEILALKEKQLQLIRNH